MPIIVGAPLQGIGQSASSSGALKAFLEAQGLGISVYRDEAPTNTARPYLTVSEAFAIVPDPLEDGAPSTVREHVTVDVWMDWKNITTVAIGSVQPGKLLESYTLPSAVAKALQGVRLATSPTTVYAAIVNSVGPRVVEREENVVHVPIWVELWRNW